MSGGSQQQGGTQPQGWTGYQGQRSNVNPWSGYTPAQAYPGQNMQNFLNLYQYPPFNRAWFTNNPQSTPMPQSGTVGTAVPPAGTPPPPVQAPQYGTPGNTPVQNQQLASAAGNPLPPPGTTNVTTPPISSPSSTPQSVFNDMLSKYGQNAAMSFAMSNRGLMGNTAMDQLGGLDPMARNQAINTYSSGSKSNDLGGDARHDLTALGNPFDPNSPIAQYRRQLGGFGG